MGYILPLLGMVGSFYLIKKREVIGDMIGEAEWMRKVGGVHNLLIVVAILLFFWCVAALTGTTSILFSPFLWLFPSMRSAPVNTGF